MAHGTWGAQVAGAWQYWELSHCCGEQRELPTWQKSEPPRGCREQAWAGGEAMPPGAATGPRWHHRTEPAQDGGQGSRGASRHQLLQLRQASRLQAVLGYKACVFSNYMLFFPSKSARGPLGNVVNENHVFGESIGCLLPKAYRPHALVSASCPCTACLITVHTQSCLASPGRPSPTRADPPFLGSVIPNVTPTVRQDLGGPQTWL